MAKQRLSYEVHVDDASLGLASRVGTLYRHETRTDLPASFAYDLAWLRSAHRFVLDPRLGLWEGEQHPPADVPAFGVFMDSAPDRWGRLLMERREAVVARREARPVRQLQEVDFLLGVNDETRTGALRFCTPEGTFLANAPMAAPPVTHLRELASIAWRIEEPGIELLPEYERWLAMLLAPGTSLGGARPKANFRPGDGSLWIAKFPAREDRYDVERWEYVLHCLAAAAGIDVPPATLEPLGEYGTFCVQRFDRHAGDRRMYASAMTLLERKDGDRDTSYVELAEFLANHGAKGAVDADLAQLFRRVVFNVMAANRDDHLRNHGFLLTSTGWRLSPAFDVNPNPAKSEHALRLDEGSALPHLDLVLRTAPYYRLRTDDAVRIVNDVRVQVARWREVAAQVGVPAREIERMDNVIMAN